MKFIENRKYTVLKLEIGHFDHSTSFDVNYNSNIIFGLKRRFMKFIENRKYTVLKLEIGHFDHSAGFDVYNCNVIFV